MKPIQKQQLGSQVQQVVKIPYGPNTWAAHASKICVGQTVHLSTFMHW